MVTNQFNPAARFTLISFISTDCARPCACAPHRRHSRRRIAKIGRRHGGGPRPAKGHHFDTLDDLDGLDDDFRVQGKQQHPKPKKKKNKRNRHRNMGQEQSYVSEDTPPLTLPERSLAAVAGHIKSGRARRIVVMTGAGISTAAGSKPPPTPK